MTVDKHNTKEHTRRVQQLSTSNQQAILPEREPAALRKPVCPATIQLHQHPPMVEQYTGTYGYLHVIQGPAELMGPAKEG